MRLKHIIPAAVLSIAIAAAQTPAAQPPTDTRPTFEAAVIKPNNSNSGNSSSHGSKGQILFENVSLKRLVERALNVKPFQVTGPSWMDDVHFDVAAKYPIDTKREDQPRMLKTLLEDRFGLVLHEETKELPGYALVVGKGGFKLKPAPGNGNTSVNGNGKDVTLTVAGITIASLVDTLGRQVNSMVVDKTALEGTYSFEMKWSIAQERAEPKLGDPDPGPSIFTMLQEVTGLKLQAEKVPTPVFVVDKIERVPTEN